MQNQPWIPDLYAILGAACVLLFPLAAWAVELPTDVRAGLEAEGAQLGPLSVSWTYSLLKQSAVRQKYIRRMDWEDGKFHFFSNCIVPRGYGSSESTFDGDVYYAGGFRQASLTKEPISKSRPETPLLQTLDYFDDAGVMIPTLPSDLRAKRTCSRVLWLIERGGQVASVELIESGGQKLLCIRVVIENEHRTLALETDLDNVRRSIRISRKGEEVVQRGVDTILEMRRMPTKLVDSTFLDPQLNYAVRRWEVRYPDGTLLRQCNNEQFVRVQGRNLWLPRKCVVDRYWNINLPEGFRIASPPLYVEVAEISDLHPRLPAGDSFMLNYSKPGTFIADRTGPNGTVRYQVPTPLESLDVRPWYQRQRMILLGISATGVVLGILYLVFSNLRRWLIRQR